MKVCQGTPIVQPHFSATEERTDLLQDDSLSQSIGILDVDTMH